MDSDEEDDFVFVGTPIEREEELTSRKKKALAESSSHLRTLPSWKQEVRDDEGRRRFHGAFTGGFSAGYYNTVGSKEGWAPKTFSSSRKNRAEVRQQSVLDFLDEDEKTEMEGHLLGTSSQFDTFGFTATEIARKQAEKEQKQRPSAIPGPVPDELVVPATESIGVKLLSKMGWRHGRSIKDSRANSLHEVRREARKAFLALSSNDKAASSSGSGAMKDGLDDLIEESATDHVEFSQCTPVYVRQPKQDLYGLGYDPYKHAPEFREMKRSRLSEHKEVGFRKPFFSTLEPSKSRRIAPGFGIGALEELDVEDEDIYASGYNYAETYVPDDEEPSRLLLEDAEKSSGKDLGFVPRFKVASSSEYQLERFDPPNIPKDFVARHKFPAPLDANNLISVPSPPEVPPPEDNNLKMMIEGVAALVARCGKLFEDISREKNKSNPLFNFLNGGIGHDYYARKLWEEQQKRNDHIKWRPDEKVYSTVQKMTAESRGKILGEKPLERTLKNSSSSVAATDVQLQSNLSDTFTKPESFRELLEAAKPFKDDPGKQERFEQFLKDKYQGGLRSTDSGKANNLSEASRARERLDFESAADAIEKAKLANQTKHSAQQLMEFTMATGLQFTSGGVEHGKASSGEPLISRKVYPKREEFQWRPAPLLCKRFDISDPFMGKPPPAPRMRSKLDSLIFTPDSAKMKKTEESILSIYQSPIPLEHNEDMAMEMSSRQPEVAVEVEIVERPVDLYKAIFSDDSDDEGEGSGISQMEDPQKKTEAASAAFSRIVAGDFLESLGKELGLEVPPDLPLPANKAGTSAPPKDGTEDTGGTNVMPKDLPSSASLYDDGVSATRDFEKSKGLKHAVDNEARTVEKPPKIENITGTSGLQKVHSNVNVDRKDRGDRKDRYDNSSSSSEDERKRKRHRRHHHRRSSSDDDSSDDSRDQHRSRSRDDKRRSSRKKHRRRRHSKHK